MTIKELKKGDFFTLKEIECPNEMQVYIRGAYDKTTKTYSAHKYGDICAERAFKPNKKVFTDFIF